MLKKTVLVLFILICGITLLGCSSTNPAEPKQKTIVATYSILGSIVKELVGDQAIVIVPIPNGADPHDWEPSARDIETINHADLLVQNGLRLEAGLEKTLAAAESQGEKIFTAADHITVRHVGPGEGIPSGDPDQVVGAPDPHLWTDPLALRDVVSALATELKNDFGLNVSARAADLANRLTELNSRVAEQIAVLPIAERKLITGHESMGYFAQRYSFRLVGVIVPGLTSQAEVSAADLANLKTVIRENQVKAIFTELGTSSAVARAIGQETGVQVIELTTHALPPDGSYFTFLTNLADVIVNALK
jgi:zinc/manganese transport system substrate-binding protein